MCQSPDNNRHCGCKQHFKGEIKLSYNRVEDELQAGGWSGVYSRLRSKLPEVVEELRQVCLEETLKLEAQRHDSLQEHTSRVKNTHGAIGNL